MGVLTQRNVSTLTERKSFMIWIEDLQLKQSYWLLCRNDLGFCLLILEQELFSLTLPKSYSQHSLQVQYKLTFCFFSCSCVLYIHSALASVYSRQLQQWKKSVNPLHAKIYRKNSLSMSNYQHILCQDQQKICLVEYILPDHTVVATS